MTTDAARPVTLTAVYVETADGTIMGYIPELPNVSARGESVEQARERLSEVLLAVIERNRRVSTQGTAGMRILRIEPLRQPPDATTTGRSTP
jgi:predicted RNase H-like HicB family nuclease